LPDGMHISNQKSQFGSILEALAVEDVGTFYGHLVHFTFIRYSLWPFGVYILCIFFPVLVCCTKKNLATLICAVSRPDRPSRTGLRQLAFSGGRQYLKRLFSPKRSLQGKEGCIRSLVKKTILFSLCKIAILLHTCCFSKPHPQQCSI
jgi:hypothetical protein